MIVAEALADSGIHLRRYDIGRTHRGPCPRCDHGPRDDALAVTIHSDDDAVWLCHRCQWVGGWRAHQFTGSKADPVKRYVQSPDMPKRSIEEQIACRKLRAVTPNDLAGRYFEGRNCALPANDVMWTPAEWHPREQRHFPCIVSKITDIVTGKPISLHFTYLDPGGDGKAKINRPRLYLAGYPKAGGVVRLHADDEVEQGVIIGEGLETCLTAAAEFAPVWSCLDAGNLAAFPVLPGIEGLTVLVDNDDAGRDAFEAVRDRYNAAGVEVVEISTSGKPGADLNDVVRA